MVLGSVLLLVLVPIVLVVIAYFISRALFRVVMAVSTVLFVIILVLGGFLIYDAYRFTGALEEGPTRFVLENETIGIETRNGTMIELSGQDFGNATTKVTFVVTPGFFSQNSTAGYEAANASVDDSLEAMRSSDPYTAYASALADAYARTEPDEQQLADHYEERLRSEYEDPSLVRSYVFGQLLASTLSIEGDDALLLGIRSGEVVVEPGRPVITFIKRMPSRIMHQSLDIEVQ